MTDAVDEDAAALAGTATGRGDDTAPAGGLNLVEVRPTPSAVGGVGVDAYGPLGEVKREVGEDAPFAAGGGGIEVREAKDDPVVGQSGTD